MMWCVQNIFEIPVYSKSTHFQYIIIIIIIIIINGISVLISGQYNLINLFQWNWIILIG
jgi:hypothetical protein